MDGVTKADCKILYRIARLAMRHLESKGFETFCSGISAGDESGYPCVCINHRHINFKDNNCEVRWNDWQEIAVIEYANPDFPDNIVQHLKSRRRPRPK